jgi:hypothetical protein
MNGFIQGWAELGEGFGGEVVVQLALQAFCGKF